MFAGGSGKSDVGMDTYSFCAALGPEEVCAMVYSGGSEMVGVHGCCGSRSN